jgi:hypothetical protein
MIGKIYLTKLKSCRCLARGQKIREPYRQKMRKMALRFVSCVVIEIIDF